MQVGFHPDAACGASAVEIRNQATANLYNYTPYQPSDATLADPDTGDACSAFGNLNFWRIWHRWFGDPEAERLPAFFPPCSRLVGGHPCPPGRSRRSRPRRAERQPATTAVGSWCTGKATDAAMKHFSAASAWISPASASIEASATDDARTQGRLAERAAAAAVLDHRARRGIRVPAHDHPVTGGDVQVREHVALAERGEQQLLGIPPLAVAVEDAVARARDVVQLPRRAHDVLAAVGAIARRALAAIALPLQLDRVVVFAEHAGPPVGWVASSDSGTPGGHGAPVRRR